MRKILIGETSSTPEKLKALALQHKTIQFMVSASGQVSELAPATKDVVILCEKSRKGSERIFATWDANYVVPSQDQCEAIWDLVQTLLLAYPEIPQKFGGAFENGFRWGATTPVEGVAAREHLQYHAGGLFQEHYMVCRAAGCSVKESMVLTVEAAKRGGKTPIPGVSKHVHPGNTAHEVQSGQKQADHPDRPPRVGDQQPRKHSQGARR